MVWNVNRVALVAVKWLRRVSKHRTVFSSQLEKKFSIVANLLNFRDSWRMRKVFRGAHTLHNALTRGPSPPKGRD